MSSLQGLGKKQLDGTVGGRGRERGIAGIHCCVEREDAGTRSQETGETTFVLLT